VHNATCVAVINTIDYLQNYLSCVHLVHSTDLLQILENFTATSVLHYHDQLLFLNKRMIQLNDVLVS